MSGPLRVERLATNESGRDFVVGDLHGMREALDRLLVHVGFESARDRLISVGDLADRGPQSFECLSLLEEPWCHAVQGNHEEQLVLAADEFAYRKMPGPAYSRLARYGGAWVLPYLNGGDARIWELVERVRRLPHVLVVGEGARRFNVVHAELLVQSLGVATDADIDDGFERFSREWALEILEEGALWGRTLANPVNTAVDGKVPGLSLTYCGHTPTPKVAMRYSHVLIDTGACYGPVEPDDWCGLTMIDAASGDIHFLSTYRKEARPRCLGRLAADGGGASSPEGR